METAYIDLRCKDANSRQWVHVFFGACVHDLPHNSQRQIVEMAYLPGMQCFSDLVLKISSKHAVATVETLIEEWSRSCPPSTSVFAIRGVEDTTPFQSSEVEVTYYRDPTKVEGHVVWLESCVRLRHAFSKLEASCQTFRSRHANMEEATRLLRSRLAHAGRQSAVEQGSDWGALR